MLIKYKNRKLERILIAVNIVTAAMVTATFVCLFGFDEPLLPQRYLFAAQYILLFIFIADKVLRFFNVFSRREFVRNYWFEIPLLLILVVVLAGSASWFAGTDPAFVRHIAVGIYLVVQVISKACRTVVNLAATGANLARTLIASFLFLIFAGTGLLMLPRSTVKENIGFVDAFFTATSASCVTGLVVKNTGEDFSIMGQIIILTLIQLGGLGIVIFGAVFALLMGQALSLRETVAMQDLLIAQTIGKIGHMIAFIFGGTIIIEALGAVSLFGMWDDAAGWQGNVNQQWFCSVFHSISAFCNAGFSLFGDNLVQYNRCWGVYVIICPLIIFGGLGFSVLNDIFYMALDKTRRIFRKRFRRGSFFLNQAPKAFRLQSKIVLTVSGLLIVFGAIAIFVLERYSVGSGSGQNVSVLDALFQSVTARTAGFNTIDIKSMSVSGRFVLMLLMFVGGSPGSTAGGIKTVTLAVVIMAVIAALRKRQEVEMFKRSVRLVVVRRAITVTMLFVFVLFTATLALSITEKTGGFDMSQIFFEAGSALGTVGLSAGITADLTTAGKLIIIIVMLIGKLGPLTLLAALTFNIKPARFNYPEEAVIVG